MTNEDIRTIAGTAYDGSKGATDPPYIELDAQAQSMLFDSASAIINYGGPTTTYEVAVAEAAAVFVPLSAPPPGGDALSAAAAKLHKEREEEKARIAAWKGAVTKEEKDRREDEEERLDKEEDRIKKAKLVKNGPDKK